MTGNFRKGRRITFSQKVKMFCLRLKYGRRINFEWPIQILGGLPICKVPGQSSIVIGKRAILNSNFTGSNTALTFKCTLVCGITGKIEIGENTCLNGVSITSYKKVIIGKNCQIASGTFIADTDFHPVDANVRETEASGIKIDHHHVAKEEIIIGDNVWIGWGSIILKGVTIGKNSIIAAGSVVNRSIPENVLAAGNPAVVKKHFNS